MSGYISTKIQHSKKNLYQWVEDTEAAAKEISTLADELDEHFQRISKAKIGGSATAIAGGVMAAVGFGLSFVTFGASLGLTVAGGIIAGAGGATAGGAAIADAVLSIKRRKKAEEAFSAYNEKLKGICKECVEIGKSLKELGDIDKMFSSWVTFWGKLVIGSGSTAKCVGWNMITSTVMNGLRIGTFIDDFARVGLQTGATAFRTIGTTAGRAAHVAGGVAGVVLLPLDFFTLVSSSIDVHKKNPHQVSKGLRQMADQLKKKCPSKSEIDEMINETLRKIQR